MKKPRIAFVCPEIYPLLKESQGVSFIGGAELQQLLLGKELSRRGYPVVYITAARALKADESLGWADVLYAYDPGAGIPGLRFFHPRLTGMWGALKRADADIYYYRTAGFLIGLISLFARRNGKKALFCGANDFDFHPQKMLVRFTRDRFLYRYGLQKAHALIAQNDFQKELCRAHFERDAVVIPNGFPSAPDKASSGEYVLWVSTIKPIKRPQWYLELAQKFPDQKFVMIGGHADPEDGFFKSMAETARQIPNLEFKGFLPFDEADRYFQKARVVVNTSEKEGFPNTFLQAWRRGVPVLSTVDLNGILEAKHGLGMKADSPEELAGALRRILEHPSLFDGESITRFFDSHYSIARSADAYEAVFQSVLSS